MLDKPTTQVSFPAAHWLSPSRHIGPIDGASQTLSPPQMAFTSTVLIWLFAGGVALPLLSAWWFPGAALTECTAAPVSLMFGREIDTTMRVADGMSCTLLTRVGSVSLQDLIVETPPRYGTVSPRGRSGIIYRAEPAYSGDDFFAISLKGRSPSEGGTMKLRVHVMVR